MKRTPQLLAEVTRLTTQGLSDADTAAALGVHPKTIWRWRQDAGIPPRKPEQPDHGTPSRYVHHSCRCDACRAAWRSRMASYQAGVQATITKAPNYGAQWTPAQDSVLTNPELGAIADRARLLGRTYFAALARLQKIREADTTQ